MACSPRDPNPLPNTFITTGLSSFSETGYSIKVYPNPVDQLFNIESENTIESLKLFDLRGCLVREREYANVNKLQVQRANLPPGFYILNLKTNKEEKRIKICFN